MQGWYWWEHFEWNLGVKEMNRNRKLQVGQEKRGDEPKTEEKEGIQCFSQRKGEMVGSTTL